MNTLYIDTHSQKIELIIFKDETIYSMTQEDSRFQHSSFIMPLLEQLLHESSLSIHDITDILVINGPGSFTGVRLGVTIAKTLAYTLNIPIRVMSSILIKAVSNKDPGYIWFADEEKNGYYVGKFNDLDELVNDYIYVKKDDYADFAKERNIILNVELDYKYIYEFSRTLPTMNPHSIKPLYVKMIEVQK